MITDEKLGELVARANMAVATGMGRTVPLPEHVAVASPVVAVVLTELIRDARVHDEMREAGARELRRAAAER